MTFQTGWTLSEWRTAYRDNKIEPREALHQVRAEFTQNDPAWIYILSAEELDQQLRQLAEMGNPDDLPLFGVPFVVKDNIDVAGLPTTAACPEFSYIADQDSTAVARLRAAGAVLLAKTNLDQFATGLVGTRSPYGAVPNSFDPNYVSGGSSSGSAVAVARGLVPFSLGTDTAGSGRVPAGFNNIVGLKPTRGRFSIAGVVPACKSLDCVSIFSLTVEDAQAVGAVLEGFDGNDGYSRIAPEFATYISATPRFGVPAALEWFGDRCAKAAWEKSLTTLKEMGAEVIPLDFKPMQELAQLLYGGPWVAERHAAIMEFMAEHADAMNPVVRTIIEQAHHFSATDAYNAEYSRAQLSLPSMKIPLRSTANWVSGPISSTSPTVQP